ncbi:MAG: phenylalanine--tRNA ligase beta subunit-related protein, partial [bacterium]|nr:phenylalanine--tRNA ligase beta subunit-related protein [bacterium]
VLEDYARIVELSAVRFMPKNKLYLPRFRTIANMLNQKPDFISFFEGLKKSSLNAEEKLILEERIKFAKIYIENYAENNVDKNSNVNNVFSLNETQRKFLQLLIEKLKTLKTSSPEEIQTMVFSILKENNFKPKEVFQGFYQTLLGKDFGPKAHDVIIQIGIPKIIEKLTLSINTTNSSNQASIKNIFPDFKNDSIFSIDPAVKKLYPSISIGIAIIKNVTIQKSNTELQSRINNFVNSQSNLTNEMISSFKEVLSYRKLYKQMSIDWHSRRPSPEALLRRIATKKGLYSVNTCVDAYNLVVMNNRVSSGAFDLDKIKFPTILRLPKPDEKILLLGDKEPTLYKPTELAYFDQNGGYNIDFNFRDSQETAVTEQTKNILINIDGIYDINRSMVEKTLKETLDEIIKYCGGKIEISGIVQ